MALAVVASFPIDAPFVPRFLEEIIDKKVCRVALNTLEEFVDWLFSWIYIPYHKLYTAKLGRIHTFNDGDVKLYDCTIGGIVSLRNDCIYLGEGEIKFNRNLQFNMAFTREAGVDFVVIGNDSSVEEGHYQITSHAPQEPCHKRSMSVRWTVNTAEHFVVPTLIHQKAYFVKPKL
ncbi:MAG: hypothetical protein COT85_06690 [Chlamydiae bacterium CG10_big_fil_rev_8_21_14_0_10_42_34]|nr:MAG: hypothetical protein COT85_06690 [Chlamydiae bacterium CG10_big_fil_rev_8_21_14_0_10_42_34]